MHGAVALPLLVGGAAGLVAYAHDEEFRELVNRQIGFMSYAAVPNTFFGALKSGTGTYFKIPWTLYVAGLNLNDRYPGNLGQLVDSAKEFVTEPITEYSPPRSFQFEWM